MVTQTIVAKPATAAMFLVLTVEPGGEEEVRDFLADLSGLSRAVGFRRPHDSLMCVTGIGARMWDRLTSAPRPAHLHPLPEFRGDVHTAVSTPGDLLFHLRAGSMDLCFELARLITDGLAGSASIVDEVHGFRYFDERDLLGFVDGTENPEGAAALATVTIGADDPDYAGGSYVIVQKYLHDLGRWNAEPVEEQERVIGRRKLDDVELADDVKPSNSHVALNTIEDPDGTERDILRDNMPFGSVGDAEFGTYFIGYAADPTITETMLENMFIGKPVGNYDRILDFSTAVTGCLFFIPSIELLDAFDSLPAAAEPGAGAGAEGSRPEVRTAASVTAGGRLAPAPEAEEADAGGDPEQHDGSAPQDDDSAGDPAPHDCTPHHGSLGIGSLRPDSTTNGEELS